MKPDYVLLKRNKLNADLFAFVYDGDTLITFMHLELYAAMDRVLNTNEFNEVDVLWRDGTRTVERLAVIRSRKFVSADTAIHSYYIGLALRTQGGALNLATYVDIRSMFDIHGPMISEIRIPCEVVADLLNYLKAVAEVEADDEDDEDFDDGVDDDFDEDTDVPEDRRLQIGDWVYRAPDWASAMTDEQVEAVHEKEVAIDADIPLPIADDATKDLYF